MIITIDGPAASGKSTVARIVANKLGYFYLCSGLLYRTISYVLITFRGYTLETLDQVTQKDIDYCFDAASFSYRYSAATHERIFFNEQDITAYLKDSFIDKVVSLLSSKKEIRHAVTQMQHMIADVHDIVIDGRDVGSVVFPQAEYKFYMTASVQVRAGRWRTDQQKKYGNDISEQDAISAITDRDERDKNRTIGPLIIPHGAVIIDTSRMSADQVVDRIVSVVKNC
jgi:CMP/dCMP kinase